MQKLDPEKIDSFLNSLASDTKESVRIQYFDLETQASFTEPEHLTAIIIRTFEEKAIPSNYKTSALDILLHALDFLPKECKAVQQILLTAIAYFHNGRENSHLICLWEILESIEKWKVKLDALDIERLLRSGLIGRLSQCSQVNLALMPETAAMICFIDGNLKEAIGNSLQIERNSTHYFLEPLLTAVFSQNANSFKSTAKSSSNVKVKLYAWLLNEVYHNGISTQKIASPGYLANKGGFAELKGLMTVCNQIEKFKNDEIKISLEQLDEMLENCKKIKCLFGEYFAIAALMALCERKEEKNALLFLQHHYQSFTKLGSNSFVWPDPLFISNKKNEEFVSSDHIPDSRNLVFNPRNLNIGKKYLGYKLKTLLGNEDHRQIKKKKMIQEVLALVSTDLRNLRGGIAKIAQIGISMESIMPSEVANEMNKVLDQCDKLTAKSIDRIILEEFGRPKEEVFEFFDPNPYRNGSIAQIHLAKITGGKNVAVKIKYSGVETSIKKDFKSLRSLKWLIAPFLKNQNLDEILNFWESGMLNECNFPRELQSMQDISKILSKIDKVKIPQVYSQFSTKNILTIEYCDGIRLDDATENYPQSTLNTIGELLVRSHFEMQVNGFYRNDIHLGNYLVDDDNLFLIDFGSIFKGEEIKELNFFEIMEAAVEGNSERLKHVLIKSSWCTEDIQINALERFIEVIGRPYQSSKFTFTHNYINELFRYMTVEAAPNLQLPVVQTPAIRFFWSMYSLLAKIGAQADWRTILLKYCKIANHASI